MPSSGNQPATRSYGTISVVVSDFEVGYEFEPPLNDSRSFLPENVLADLGGRVIANEEGLTREIVIQRGMLHGSDKNKEAVKLAERRCAPLPYIVDKAITYLYL